MPWQFTIASAQTSTQPSEMTILETNVNAALAAAVPLIVWMAQIFSQSNGEDKSLVLRIANAATRGHIPIVMKSLLIP